MRNGARLTVAKALFNAVNPGSSWPEEYGEVQATYMKLARVAIGALKSYNERFSV